MKALDAFLLRHEVDVGKCMGLLAIVESVEAFFEIIAYALIGQLNLNLAAPLGLWVGIALWRHKPWSRTLLIVLGWMVTGIFAVILAWAPFMGNANLTLKVGDLVIKNPPLWQTYVFAVLVTPLLWFIFAVLYSQKAASEFLPPPKIDHRDPPEPSQDVA